MQRGKAQADKRTGGMTMAARALVHGLRPQLWPSWLCDFGQVAYPLRICFLIRKNEKIRTDHSGGP